MREEYKRGTKLPRLMVKAEQQQRRSTACRCAFFRASRWKAITQTNGFKRTILFHHVALGGCVFLEGNLFGVV